MKNILLTVFLAFSSTIPALAQVGLSDLDHDGVPDIFELYGFEKDGHRIDFPGMGANPFRRDVFVEVDAMEGIDIPSGTFERVIQAFSKAPLVNLNNSGGISLHITPIRKIPFYNELDFNIESQGQRKNGKISTNRSGTSVIVWQDDSDNNGYYQIYANVIDNTGRGTTPKVINPVSEGQQVNPDVAINDAGNFVVVWQDDRDQNGYYEIFARMYNSSFNPTTGEILVNSVSAGQQTHPSVIIDSSNNFLVIWEDDRDGNGFQEINGRRFNSNGQPLHEGITINPVGSGQQRNTAVAMNSNGEAIVSWEDDRDGNDFYEIWARRIDVNGNLGENEIHVNTEDDGQQFAPSVSINDAGTVAIAWQDDQDGNGFYETFARTFTRNGTASTTFRINARSDGQQRSPAIIIGSSGAFTVAWEDDTDANGLYQIIMRQFGNTGNPLSGNITVNTFAEGQQRAPELTTSDNGQLYFCYADKKTDNNTWSVRYKILSRFGNSVSADLTPHTDIRSFESIKEEYFTDINRTYFHYCVIANRRFNTGSSGIANVGGQNPIVSLGTAPSIQKLANTFMHELGHNLGLHHGGNERVNDKPNYLSVMNYRYQFGGADNNCDASSTSPNPEDLNYSYGGHKDLNEQTLNEKIGICEGEKKVNPISDGQQRRPAIHMNNAGAFAIAWQDDFDNNGKDQIYGRIYGSDGVARSAHLKINTDNSGQQRNPCIGIASSGSAIAAWEDDRDGNGSYQIYAQRLDIDGKHAGSEILVNQIASGNQIRPSISVTGDGIFAVAWQDDRNEDGRFEIYCRVFASNGSALTGNIKVSERDNTNEQVPKIAINDARRIIVVWEDDRNLNGYFEIYAQVFNSDFTKSGISKLVNQNSDNQQRNPDVGIAANGNFVVVWEDDSNGNRIYEISGRRFSASGQALENQFTVNQNGDGQQRYPRVAVNSNFEYSVTWQDDRDENGYFQIFTRNYNSSGTAKFIERTVNLVADGQQNLPAVGTSGDGSSCIVWQDDRDNNNYFEIVCARLNADGTLKDRTPIDWDGDGNIDNNSVEADINDDDELSVLRDFNDWNNIVLKF